MKKQWARRLPKHRGVSGWSAVLPQSESAKPLTENVRADVAIVGGGFAGLSAAQKLLELDANLKVVVLEAGRIGEGAAGRNSGFMIDLPHELTSEDYAGDQAQRDRQLTKFNRLAIEFTSGVVQSYGITPSYFERCGKINGAASQKGHDANLTYADYLNKLGEKCEILDQKSMKELTGSSHFISGLFTPGTALIQPAGYVQGFANGLARSGVRVAENSPVLSMERAGGVWTLETPEGRVETPKVILANNGHLQSFGYKPGRLMHIFLFAAMTAELDSEALKKLGGHSHWGVTPSDPMGTTVRRINTGQGGNRLVTRTCAVYQPNMETSARQLKRANTMMREKFDQRYPQLAGFPMQYSWAGHLCLTYNGVSVVEELEPGLFSACVQNGLGTTRGALTGMAAAEMVLGVTSEISQFFMAEEQPKRLPPEPFACIGANAYLRWRERVAAQD